MAIRKASRFLLMSDTSYVKSLEFYDLLHSHAKSALESYYISCMSDGIFADDKVSFYIESSTGDLYATGMLSESTDRRMLRAKCVDNGVLRMILCKKALA